MSTTGTEMISAEPTFMRSLGSLPPEEQRACLAAVSWFERESPDQRNKTSWKVDTTRRRIRAVRASKQTLVLYAMSNSGQNWIWAGWHGGAESAAARLDSLPIESPEPIGVDALLANLDGIMGVAVEIETPSPADVEEWSTSVEEAAVTIADIRSLCGRIKAKVAGRIDAHDALSKLSDERLTENARLKAELEAKLAPKPEDGDLESRLTTAITRYNAARVEIEELKKEVKSLTKRIRTADAELSIRRGAGDHVSAAKEQVEKLEQELGALKAASKKEAVAAMTDLIVDGIKDQCSKVLDDAANRLSATERPMDEIHAEDLRRLAMRIRALKVKVKA